MLIQKVEKTLKDYEFSVCKYENLCVDMAAKREEELFLLKILFNVDSLQKEQAYSLKVLSNMLDARSYVIGHVTRLETLKDGVVYERFELPVMTPKTLEIILNENIVLPRRGRGGLFVTIDPEKLRRARKRRGLTRAQLARLVKTTKKNIYDHERREFGTSIELVEKLERVLGENIRKIGINKHYEVPRTKPKTRLEKRIADLLLKIGFDVVSIKKAPIDLIIKERFLILSEITKTSAELKRRVEVIKSFSRFVEEPAIIISSEKIEEELSIPLIDVSFLEYEVKRPSDLERVIKTFK